MLKAVSGGGGGSAGGSTSNTNLATSINNATAVLLPKTRAALGRVKAGNGNAKIIVVSDSLGFGVGSNGTLNTGDLKLLAWPTQLAKMFNVSGVNANSSSFFGNSAGTVTNIQNDSRIAITGGTTTISQTLDSTLGGDIITFPANTACSLSFTPTVPVDTFQFYYAGGPGAGIYQYNLNGGASTSINAFSASNSVANITVTGSLGVNNFTVSKGVTAGLEYYLGIIATNSTISQLNIINAGWSGAAATDKTGGGSYPHSFGSPWNPRLMIPAVGTDLTIISLAGNDWNTANSVASFTIGLQELITAAIGAGDVLLVAPTVTNPAGGSNIPYATQQQYITAIYNLAITNNIPLLDMWARTNPWATGNANNMWFDANHLNGTGYSDDAQAVFNIIGNI